jgi:putative transposase
MGTRKFPLVLDEFYHVYNRGVEKRVIFQDKYDYQRFVELLFLMNSLRPVDLRLVHQGTSSAYDFERGEQVVAIGAYCLMSNHFHILLTPLVENGISIFMGKVGTSYSMYFNKKYERNGALFQGKFKAQWVNADPYLKYLLAYIHLNPVKLIDAKWQEEGIKDAAKAHAFAASFQYSSLQDYMAMLTERNTEKSVITRAEAALLQPDAFPKYFETAASKESELQGWLAFKDFIPQNNPSNKGRSSAKGLPLLNMT